MKRSSLARLQTLIAIKDKELKLMKKKLLITTALVAAFTATNAYTMEINTDTEITGEGQARWLTVMFPALT